MPWKTEIDRLVHHLVLDAAKGGESELKRAARTVRDLAALAPERPATFFHLGALEELLERQEADEEALEAIRAELPEPEGEGADRWRHLGHLDGASRRSDRDRVHALMDEEAFEGCIEHPEGRVALRAVGRMLLREGAGDTVFDLYRRHLAAVDEEGSRRDAEFLLEESLRRADRGDTGEEETIERLHRAAAFAEEAGLDARARSKVDRKLGRLHQLAGRTEDATTCYRRALDRLPEDDPYRSVLLGDLALATLGVRGTLDLLPADERERRDEALSILQSGEGGDGRSYNAIYTLGMLAYEQQDWETAASSFREADQLMRDNRAKARIVHARSRFFLGHCLLALAAEGDDLAEAERFITKNASAVSLEPETKEPVFDALVEKNPRARVPGRPGPRSRGGEGSRPTAPQHLEKAKELLESDPHEALEYVDRAFKSRPDFDTWLGAYTTRLEALLALDEREEALRTYERLRSKLYQREAHPELEALLRDEDGAVRRLLDDEHMLTELVDLYDAMPDHQEAFAENCLACAKAHAESGDPERLARAIALYRELEARDGGAVAEALEAAVAAAQEAGAHEEDVPREEIADLLKGEEDPVRLVVVGGDKGRARHAERFQTLAKELGFEGDWIFTGVRPPYKTLREIAGAAQDADVILMHHALGPDMRREVLGLGEKYDVPVRQAAWLGEALVEQEVLRTLKEAFVE